MASEPELRLGGSGEWVLYLRQSLNHHYRQSVIAESGEFDAALDAVLRHFQRQQGIAPTGVVDAATWAALTDTAAPAGDAVRGTAAYPAAIPAPYLADGASALRYHWPAIPVASAAVDVGAALVELALTLTGESTVAFPHHPAGVTAGRGGLGLAAGAALDGLTNGLSVSNLDSASPTVSAAVGTEFRQTSAGPLTPDGIEFGGSAHLDYRVATDQGHAEVTGRLGYRLGVSVTPHTRREEVPVPDTAPGWVESHAEDLAPAGLVVLVAAFAIALAPETGGASLIPLGA